MVRVLTVQSSGERKTRDSSPEVSERVDLVQVQQTLFMNPSRISVQNALFGNLAVLCFVVVQYLDGAFTYIGLHIWGLGIEANPLVSSAVSMAGVGGGLIAAKLAAIGLGILLHLRQVHAIVAILTAFYVAVAILPWTFLFMSL